MQLDMQSLLKAKGIQLLSLQVSYSSSFSFHGQKKRVIVQTSQDNWSCHNGVKEGNEGDVDCGGNCLKKCSEKQTCNVAEDCDEKCSCNHGVCELANSTFFVSNNNIVPVVSLCCVTVCVFLIVGTFISHNKKKQTTTPFEQLKECHV